MTFGTFPLPLVGQLPVVLVVQSGRTVQTVLSRHIQPEGPIVLNLDGMAMLLIVFLEALPIMVKSNCIPLLCAPAQSFRPPWRYLTIQTRQVGYSRTSRTPRIADVSAPYPYSARIRKLVTFATISAIFFAPSAKVQPDPLRGTR